MRAWEPFTIRLSGPHNMIENDWYLPGKRYPVSETFLEEIQKRGFEINVHDLNHDGHLFSDREEFLRRAERINCYGQRFGALGFRSAGLYRNVDWYDSLDFSYDMSIP